MISYIKPLKLLTGLATALVLASNANAQTIGVDIDSVLPAFQPVALGENIDLNPCGSSVLRGNTTQVLNSICSTSEPDRFSVNYLISRAGTTSALTFGTAGQGVAASIASLVSGAGGTVQSLGNAAAGLGTNSIATGAGTLFSTAGTYVISLITAVQGGITIIEPNAANQRTFNDNGLEISNSGFSINGATVGNFDGTVIGNLSGGVAATANGLRNVGFAQATIVVQPASVPEPSSLFVLASGLVGFASHRRRKKCLSA